MANTTTSRGDDGLGWVQRFTRLRPMQAVVLLLVISVTGNMLVIVKYRVPSWLWRMERTWRRPVPKIALGGTFTPQLASPALAFPNAVLSPRQVKAWRRAGRAKLTELLSDPLSRKTASVRTEGSERVGGITRDVVVFTMSDGLEVPAFLLYEPYSEPRPGVLVIPGHSWGIRATAGIYEDYQHANALEIARAGFTVLTMEVRGFGYLFNFGSPETRFDRMSYVGYALTQGFSALGRTVADAASGVDYLAGHPHVSEAGVAVVGFSSGGKAAIYLSALYNRVQAVVASGCVSSHEATFRYSRHDPYEAVPGIGRWLEMSDVLGLLAPRPLLVHWGALDRDPESRFAAFNESSPLMFAAARRIYAAAGRPAAIEQRVTPNLWHEFDNAAAIDFLWRSFRLERSGAALSKSAQ